METTKEINRGGLGGNDAEKLILFSFMPNITLEFVKLAYVSPLSERVNLSSQFSTSLGRSGSLFGMNFHSMRNRRIMIQLERV